jgi:hypothetical protein
MTIFHQLLLSNLFTLKELKRRFVESVQHINREIQMTKELEGKNEIRISVRNMRVAGCDRAGRNEW